MAGDYSDRLAFCYGRTYPDALCQYGIWTMTGVLGVAQSDEMCMYWLGEITRSNCKGVEKVVVGERLTVAERWAKMQAGVVDIPVRMVRPVSDWAG